MNLISAISLLYAGTSEGAKKAWDTRGRGRKEKELSPRAQRAIASYVPMTHDKHALTEIHEKMIAKALGGSVTKDHSPFDVLVGKMGIEVKTVFPGVKNNKITMHKESRERKLAFMKANKIKKAFTVVVDTRDHSIYIGEGLKSFRFKMGGMHKVTSTKDLKGFMR